MNSNSDIVNATMYDFRASNTWSHYAKSTVSIEYTYSNAYPCPNALPEGIVLDGNKPSKFNRQPLGKSPSDTPSLSSSSSLSSASPEEDDDAHITHASQTPIRYTNSLIQKISLVDKLVETTSAVIDAIWWPSIETQNVKVVSTSQFVKEILKRSKSTYSTLQAALYYIFRIKQKIMDHTAERNTLPAQQSSPQDCIFCGRRMFLAAVMVASKFLQDKTYRNSAWAKISGLTTSEISYSEMAFLKLIEFRLFISKETFEMWHRMLTQHISQLINTLPTNRRLPPASRAALNEICNYGYQSTINSKALDYTHEPYFVNILKSPDAMVAKRNAYHDPTQHRKKLCQ
ncbi:hypothetical protein K450DRAFT_196552 [Umbelopsis ramanniana AG]|uniref:Uncharacterized protein n=1 Tax=Umbelopsis ramanniana AG TaxID=1314678 RepID=A0AAD5EFW6_UMBRA|nr:uncharacterized protein K450DRAFT_196552 [Umbelopsis ramanniana AG]KAI8582968.1 hypothetical protein K450DRAFT_196552 [Umbelopsis ramanniana AG]